MIEGAFRPRRLGGQTRHVSASYVQDRSNDDDRYCSERQTQQCDGPYAGALRGLRLHASESRLDWWLDHLDWWLDHLDWWLDNLDRWLDPLDWWLDHVDWWLDRPRRLKRGFYRACESVLDIIVRRQVGLSYGRALEIVYAARAGILRRLPNECGSAVIQAEPQSRHLRLRTIERRARSRVRRVRMVPLGRRIALISITESTGQLYEAVL